MKSNVFRVAVLALLMFAGWQAVAEDAPVVKAALSPGEVALRVMTFNVLGSNRDYDRFSAYVEEASPDIVLLQEARSPWIEDTILATYPYRVNAGMNLVVASRFPFLDDGRRPVSGKADRALRVLVDVGEPEPIAVYAFHPSTPRQKNGVTIQAEDYRRIAAVVAEEPADRVVIGGGDFNTVPTSDVFRTFADRTGLRVLADESIGVPTRFAKELGMPVWLGVAIDHVVGRGDISLVSRTVGPDLGSDHLPVLVDLVVR